MKTYANLRIETVRLFCACCGVSERFAKQFQTLANHGEIRGEVFRAVLRTPAGKRVIAKILAELSKGLEHKFPPKDWQPGKVA